MCVPDRKISCRGTSPCNKEQGLSVDGVYFGETEQGEEEEERGERRRGKDA